VNVDTDSDGVCDTSDLCTDLTATNYAANPTAACTYTTSGFTIDACDGQASVSFDLDTMTVATNSWTYSILSSISGFATEGLVTDLVTLDFSPTGVGNDTLLIQATTGAVTENIQIVVNEWEYPVRTSPLIVTAASSPSQVDGTISTTFTGHYSANVTMHANGTTVPMVSGVGVLRSAHYVVEGYTNVKGCYNPEPATSSTPGGTPSPVSLVLPCLKCH
jgi:hypothetical protein